MNVLVTGASGFIGSRLALQLKHNGVDVTATGMVNSAVEQRRLTELQNAGISVVVGPLQNCAAMRALVPTDGIVIHLAAAQHEANVPDAYFHEVNVEGTRTLLELSRAAGVRRFVYGSTIGVYGGMDAHAQQRSAPAATAAAKHHYRMAPLDETTAPRPQNAYGRSKLAAEQLVNRYGADLEVCIVRIAETYGPGDMRMLKLFRAIGSGRFVMIGSGDNYHQPIHVRDLIDGLLVAATHPSACAQTFVLAGSEPATTRELVANVAAALGRSPPRLQLPLLPFVGAALLLEAGLRPLGIQPPLHRRRLDFFRKSFVFSIAKAQQVLGFTPRHTLRSGTVDAAHWYRAQGLLQEN